MKPRRALRPESANRCKVIDSLSLRNTPLLFHGKHLASCGVAAGPKLCCRAHLLINIYIFLHSHLSLGKCCICRSDCGLKRTHIWKKNVICFCSLYIICLFIHPKCVLIWSVEQQAGGGGVKLGKFGATFSWHRFNTLNFFRRGFQVAACTLKQPRAWQ